MKITRLTLNFEVTDMKRSVAYYEKSFGFKLIMAVPATQDGIGQSFTEGRGYAYAVIQKDNVEIFFQCTDTLKEDVAFVTGLPVGTSVSFYMDIKGIDEFHQQMRAKELEITELKTTWYGVKEFCLKGANGRILGFAGRTEQ